MGSPEALAKGTVFDIVGYGWQATLRELRTHGRTRRFRQQKARHRHPDHIDLLLRHDALLYYFVHFWQSFMQHRQRTPAQTSLPMAALKQRMAGPACQLVLGWKDPTAVVAVMALHPTLKGAFFARWKAMG